MCMFFMIIIIVNIYQDIHLNYSLCTMYLLKQFPISVLDAIRISSDNRISANIILI